MPVGIVAYGAYIPVYRLSLDTLAKMWGSKAGRGEKAIANWDEDSLTMATEAVIDCLGNLDPASIDSLYFSTMTPPYRQKQGASIVAKVIDMRRDVMTMDITNSSRGASIALVTSLNAIKAGAAKRVIVAAADCRVPAPDSELERLLGDGAAALLLGDTDVAVEVEGSLTISSEFIDIWQREKDPYAQAWEDRFIIQHGYIEHLTEVISGLLSRHNLTPADFTKAILYAYDSRRHAELARKLGFTPEQVQDPLLTTIGHTGTASAPMMLVAALEDAKPGDRILFANYGDGADAFILRVTDHIEKLRGRRGVKKHLASMMTLESYGKYLHFRDLMNWGTKFGFPKYASLTMYWRDREWILGGKGSRCNSCGNIVFPPQRICSWCQATDKFELVRLSHRKGALFTYSIDNLAVTVDPPNVIAIVDLEGGGRFSTVMTDRDPGKLAPEMPVELTFRRFHEEKNMHNYFWKCRPVRA